MSIIAAILIYFLHLQTNTEKLAICPVFPLKFFYDVSSLATILMIEKSCGETKRAFMRKITFFLLFCGLEKWEPNDRISCAERRPDFSGKLRTDFGRSKKRSGLT